MKYSEVEKRLKDAGCYFLISGDHPWWYSPITGMKFKLSHHRSEEVKPGTLKAISKASGVKF